MKHKKTLELLSAYTLLSLLLNLSTACSNGQVSSKHVQTTTTDTITTFVLPEIPAMLNSPELRADYLAKHYWDNVNFADTNYIHHPEVTEQAWVNFIEILRLTSSSTSDTALKKLFAQAEKEKKCYMYLTSLADKYLYDPNSPMRNEELYISVLDAILKSPAMSDTDKIRPQARRKLAQKNRIGTKALDFIYMLANGKQSSLYNVKAPYTLLFINNPGCNACSETIEALKSSPSICRATAQKSLKILSIYPDADLVEWKRHLSDFPKEWINGYDKKQTIEQQNLYDLKAIPTLYLLDKDKTVLLKDATSAEIEEYLKKNIKKQ
ncbi:DUF5106 domain-containing protein [Bacteroides gallinarum]|uniref:DUF5106 domain-containing protein n=1 Tax=Bacteroides gallinarum TaxID=376806 RepID=UPI00036A9382|nr:DUF5106 domain-containing protein [Bacteroides gallinarum]